MCKPQSACGQFWSHTVWLLSDTNTFPLMTRCFTSIADHGGTFNGNGERVRGDRSVARVLGTSPARCDLGWIHTVTYSSPLGLVQVYFTVRSDGA